MKRVNLLLLGLLLVAMTVGFYRQLLDDRSFRSRDHFDFYLRVHQYGAEVADGHWPQTLPDAVRGAGHAFPRFYPPVSQFVALGAHALLDDVVRASHYAALASVALSVVGLFGLVVRLTGSPGAGLAAATAYAAFPYRFTQLYERGAFAESWAMVWYPLILLGGVEAIRRERVPRWWPLVVAGLVLSHAALALWVLPILGVLLVVTAEGAARRRVMRAGVAAGAWAMGLAALYVVPVLAGLGSVRASDPLVMLSEPAVVAAAGVAGFWPGSVFLSLVVALTGAACLIVALRRLTGRGFLPRLVACLMIALTGLAGMLVAPEWLWSLIPAPLRYIQFPWRLFGPIAFLGCLALGIMLARVSRWAPRTATAVFAAAGLVLGGTEILSREYTGQQVVALLGTPYPDLGLTLAGDYLPRGTHPDSLARAIQRTKDGVGRAPLAAWENVSGTWMATVEVSEPGPVLLPLVAYDFHRVTTAGGVEVPTGSQMGQLYVVAQPGQMRLGVSRRMPVSVTLGLLTSVATVVLLALGLPRKNGRATASPPNGASPSSSPASRT